ncbi:MAG: hypothetical protein ACOC80_15985, partial [Petrotogales bacterium]
IQTFLNLDTLEFSRGTVNLQITDEFLGTQKEDDLVKIYYKNYAEDNDDVNVKIYDTNTSDLLLNTNSITDPNEFTLYFDTSTLDISTGTLFKVVVTKTVNGETSETIKYFNLNAKSGIISSGAAFMIGIGVFVFGLSIVASSAIFNWFGIIVGAAVIVIATLGVSIWYLTMLQFFGFMLIVYSIINLMVNKQEGLV